MDFEVTEESFLVEVEIPNELGIWVDGMIGAENKPASTVRWDSSEVCFRIGPL